MSNYQIALQRRGYEVLQFDVRNKVLSFGGNIIHLTNRPMNDRRLID